MRHEGFSLIELLAAVGIGGLLMAGAIGVFGAHTRGHTREDLTVVMQDNLRLGMDVIVASLRGAGDGVPDQDLETWIPWVGGFTTRPVAIAADPAALSLASSTSQPVVRVSSAANAGATTLQVTSAVSGRTVVDELDTDSKRLIVIDDDEPAHVVSMNGGTITLDTDPLVDGNQGLLRGYPVGTPIRRVDVLTYQVGSNESTGSPELHLDQHQGGAALVVAEGISTLEVTAVVDGRVFEIGLKAESEMPDPLTGKVLEGGLRTDVTLRN